jgi:hypothetical protein
VQSTHKREQGEADSSIVIIRHVGATRCTRRPVNSECGWRSRCNTSEEARWRMVSRALRLIPDRDERLWISAYLARSPQNPSASAPSVLHPRSALRCRAPEGVRRQPFVSSDGVYAQTPEPAHHGFVCTGKADCAQGASPSRT